MESTKRSLAAVAESTTESTTEFGPEGFEFVIKDVQIPTQMGWMRSCSSRSVTNLINTADRFARAADPILIVGECGTGKEQLAQHIHRRLENGPGRLIRVACGKLGSELDQKSLRHVESWSELLKKAGQHQKVTWLFDRIDEIPAAHQPLISGLLDEILKSADKSEWPCVISTARSELTDAMTEGAFREDLYYALNVLELRIPPLRERKEDIPALLGYFLNVTNRFENAPLQLSPQAETLLCEYYWPGNVSELRNVVSKISVLSESSVIDSNELLRYWNPSKRISRTDLMGLKLEDAETHLILEAVSRCEGNKTAAAKQLGITTRTLQNKMQKYRRMGYVE